MNDLTPFEALALPLLGGYAMRKLFGNFYRAKEARKLFREASISEMTLKEVQLTMIFLETCQKNGEQKGFLFGSIFFGTVVLLSNHLNKFL